MDTYHYYGKCKNLSDLQITEGVANTDKEGYLCKDGYGYKPGVT